MQPLANWSKEIKLKVIEATFIGLHMSKTVLKKSSIKIIIDMDHHLKEQH